MNAPDVLDFGGPESFSAPGDLPGTDPGSDSRSTRPWSRGVYDGVVILVASWLAVLTATAEAFFTPFRLFDTLIPVSVLAAAVLTPLLVILPFRVTGRLGLSLIPAGLWMATAFFWSQGSSEGDVVLSSDIWVSLAYLFVGSGAAAFGAYRVVIK